jgi:hypothetical protein
MKRDASRDGNEDATCFFPVTRLAWDYNGLVLSTWWLLYTSLAIHYMSDHDCSAPISLRTWACARAVQYPAQ